jgi:hypothetical protein
MVSTRGELVEHELGDGKFKHDWHSTRHGMRCGFRNGRLWRRRMLMVGLGLEVEHKQ